MSDLPHQGLFQQMHARSISGEHLEVLGKQASARWDSGEYKTLSEAVVDTVKHAGLSPEQVKRVIEFANTDAYLRDFKKEGSGHHVVDWKSGPADPSEVLKDLNDGGGGSVFDPGTGDYHHPPSETKTASSLVEEKLAEALFREEAPMVQHNSYVEVEQLRHKLAGMHDALNSELDSLEIQYADVADQVYREVKQAAMGGASLGEIVQAWTEVAPSPEYVKVAFELLTPRLVREEVFHSHNEIVGSLQKTAGAALVNMDHPLVHDFQSYCDTLSKLASYRQTTEELRGHVGALTSFLKQADGLIPKAWRASKRLSAMAGNIAGAGAEHLLAGSGKPVAKALSYAPEAAAIIGANEAHLRIQSNPLYQNVLGVIPYTDEYNMKKMMLQQQGMGGSW